MNLIRLSIERPVAVIAAVLMVVMFGVLALTKIPIQLTPDVRKPVISLQTIWPGAAPVEIEREITNRQEEVLKGIRGLEQITSESQDGRSRVTLEFAVGTNMEEAMLLVSNRLDRVEGYPSESTKPSMHTASSDDSPITWIVLLRNDGNDAKIHTFGDFTEDVIQDRLERVKGVARVNVYGSAVEEMEVVIKPERMARYGLPVSEVAAPLRAANASLRAGEVNLRTGPGLRYPVAWVFVREALPVEVIGEFGDWRQVRDHDGAEGWVHRVLLSGRRSVLVTGGVRVLRREPRPESSTIARVEPGVQGWLNACRSEWCEIDLDGHRGWMPRDYLWGVYAARGGN